MPLLESLRSSSSSASAVYTSTVNPTANNDAVDTAGLGRVFTAGTFWLNTSSGGMFLCTSATATAAVWRRDTIFQIDGSLITDTSDGWVTIGASAFPNRPGFTDANGIAIVNGSNVKKGIVSEVDGDRLSFGINATPFGDRSTANIGGLIRFDADEDNPYFTVLRYPISSSSSLTDIRIDIDGRIGLGAGATSGLNAIVAITGGTDDIDAVNLMLKLQTDQSSDFLQLVNADNDLIGGVDYLGAATFTALSLSNGHNSISKTITTVGAVTSTIHTIPITTNNSYYIKIRAVVARTTATNESGVFERFYMVKDISGTITLTQVGIANVSRDTIAGTVDIVASVSGTNVIIEVTGETAKSLKWAAVIEYQSAG